ncbi:MAG: hypothetical protein GW892_00225 [Armatimonadetes bacterium]|nr:hypothetical protein [Armatimonadota bacterium]NCO93607.1 hypothetical protein [Armatimonadota bacterium]
MANNVSVCVRRAPSGRPGRTHRPVGVAAIATSLLLTALAAADWRDHPELPDWARRGYVQWGHGANIDGRIKWGAGGFGADVANVKLLLYCGRNLQQTIASLDDEAARLANEGGLRRQPYICSQTVWWRTEETKTPELIGAVRQGLDAKPIIIYSNPDRHCGCYNAPFWLEYTKQKIKTTVEGGGIAQRAGSEDVQRLRTAERGLVRGACPRRSPQGEQRRHLPRAGEAQRPPGLVRAEDRH